MPAVTYREAVPGDRRFVLATWLDSYRTAHAAGQVPMDEWDGTMRPFLERILDRPGCETWVAAHPDESPDSRADLYGWCSLERVVRVPDRNGAWREAEGPLVHYVYVKKDYRRHGIAKGLLTAAGIRLDLPFLYTCKTGICSKILPAHARWAPLVARYPKDGT